MKVQNCFRLKIQIHSSSEIWFPEIVPSALKETIEVETVLKGKLRESDPIQTTLPMTSPEDLLKYLFNDVGLVCLMRKSENIGPVAKLQIVNGVTCLEGIISRLLCTVTVQSSVSLGRKLPAVF